MGTSLGPTTAFGGLLSGIAEGMERKRANARQDAAIAEAKAEKDRYYQIDKADAADRQAEFRNRLGLVEDDPTSVEAATGAQAPALPISRYEVTAPTMPTTRAAGTGPPQAPSLLNAAVTAFKTNGTPGPRYTLPNLMGPGQKTYRVDPTQTPEAIRTREQAALQAAEMDKLVKQEQAKAADAERKQQGENMEAFGAFQAAFPKHPKATAYQPSTNYKLLLDVSQKQADREATLDAAKANRDATIAASRANAELAHEDRVAALGAKTAKGGTATKALAAPIAAKVGQFGEMVKKADDLLKIQQDLDVTIGKSAARDISEHGIAGIPGTKGIGSALTARSPAYAQYQAALSPFILAAAHALSGARINQDQVEQIRKSVELAPGDIGNPTVRAQKTKNLIDLINSIGGSLPKGAIGEQEGQMDEEAIGRLTGHGYKRIGTAVAGGDKIDPAHFAKLSKADQDYFRSKGRAP